eukprot:3469113-Rhodomonas_salina.1
MPPSMTGITVTINAKAKATTHVTITATINVNVTVLSPSLSACCRHGSPAQPSRCLTRNPTVANHKLSLQKRQRFLAAKHDSLSASWYCAVHTHASLAATNGTPIHSAAAKTPKPKTRLVQNVGRLRSPVSDFAPEPPCCTTLSTAFRSRAGRTCPMSVPDSA